MCSFLIPRRFQAVLQGTIRGTRFSDSHPSEPCLLYPTAHLGLVTTVLFSEPVLKIAPLTQANNKIPATKGTTPKIWTHMPRNTGKGIKRFARTPTTRPIKKTNATGAKVPADPAGVPMELISVSFLGQPIFCCLKSPHLVNSMILDFLDSNN